MLDRILSIVRTPPPYPIDWAKPEPDEDSGGEGGELVGAGVHVPRKPLMNHGGIALPLPPAESGPDDDGGCDRLNVPSGRGSVW